MHEVLRHPDPGETLQQVSQEEPSGQRGSSLEYLAPNYEQRPCITESSRRQQYCHHYHDTENAGIYQVRDLPSCLSYKDQGRALADVLVEKRTVPSSSNSNALTNVPIAHARPLEVDDTEAPSSSAAPPPIPAPNRAPMSFMDVPSPTRSTPPPIDESRLPTYRSTELSWNNEWQTRGQTIVGNATEDYFGYTMDMSLDGSTIVVSAYKSNLPGPDSGIVQVFRFDLVTEQWEQMGQTIYGPSEDISFCRDVAINANGTIIALGHARATVDGIPNAGRVSIFQYHSSAVGNSSWVPLGHNIVGSEPGHDTGWSVAMSSDGMTVACGELHGPGEVRIFRYNQSTKEWKQIGQTLGGIRANDMFGLDIDLSANGSVLVVAISTPLPTDVLVYEYSSQDDAWIQLGQALAIDNEGDPGFEQHGISVSLSAGGRTVAAGNNLNDNAAWNAGHVRVFEYAANVGTWNQLGQDLEGEYSDLFGDHVALSSSGRVLAVGARSGQHGGFSKAGYIAIYQYNGATQAWSRVGNKLYGNDGDGHSDGV